MNESQPQKEPISGWDTEDKHLIGMPSFIRNDPRAAASGWLRPLCKRCAAIPWSEFSSLGYGGSHELRPVFGESAEKLYNSPCRVCYLFSFIKVLDWVHFLGHDPAMSGSPFGGKLRFFPGSDQQLPAAATPDLLGYVGIIDKLEGNIPFPRPTPEYADYRLAQQCLKECNASHSDSCAPDDSTNLYNLQVIDCETRVVTSAPTTCAYVALSYVWGPPSKADAEYVFPNLPAQLPPTIEDAIRVTKRLGIRYIWIDRYCINQNDPEDKMRQILQMGAIYSSAQLTIIAAAGEGPQHGLPGVSEARRTPMPYGEVVGSVALVVTSLPAIQEVFESKWASRAWTFQEGFLSRRRLFFTNNIMLYVCGKGLKGDVCADYSIGDVHERRTLQRFLPLEAPLLATDDFVVQNKTMTLAGRQLKAFSLRNLSYDSDSLNAILGILDELSKKKVDPSYHIWGVPFAMYSRNYDDTQKTQRISYEIALNWYHEGPCPRREGFPSWSSIGWNAPIEYSYQDQPMVPDDIDVRILNNGTPTTLDSYATSGLARKLSGLKEAPNRLKLVEARTVPIKTADIDGYVRAVLKVSNNLDIYQWVSWDEFVPVGTQNLVGVIIYQEVQSRRLVMLILALRDGDFYERVGFVMFDEDYVVWNLGDGLVRIHGSDDKVTDLQYLKDTLERSIGFVEEERRDIILA